MVYEHVKISIFKREREIGTIMKCWKVFLICRRIWKVLKGGRTAERARAREAESAKEEEVVSMMNGERHVLEEVYTNLKWA